MGLKPGSSKKEGVTETAGGRKNPRQRRINPWDAIDSVQNKADDQHYVWVQPGSGMLEYYEHIGYERVVFAKDGPRPTGTAGLKEGDFIEGKLGWLMSISLAELGAYRADRRVHVDDRTEAIRRGTGVGRSDMTDRRGIQEYTQASIQQSGSMA